MSDNAMRVLDEIDARLKAATPGDRYGRLTLVERRSSDQAQKALWLVRCDCGNSRVVRYSGLRSGNTKSCGCLSRETSRRHNSKHGHSRAMWGQASPTYNSWSSMVQRCTNPRYNGWHWYGGRGVKVCDRWLDFEAFLADMGHRPRGRTLDRIDNQRGYEPGNCRWATPREQGRNTRRCKPLTYRGETLVIREWAERLGISHTTITRRLVKYPVEVALDPEFGRRELSGGVRSEA